MEKKEKIEKSKIVKAKEFVCNLYDKSEPIIEIGKDGYQIYKIGKAFKNDKLVEYTFETNLAKIGAKVGATIGSALGSIIPVLGTSLGATIGGIIGTLLAGFSNRLFG